MKTYKHDPTDHSITVHQHGSSPRVIGYGPHTTSKFWAYNVAHAILFAAIEAREAVKHCWAMAQAFERIKPGTHWSITMGDGGEMGEIDTWLALRRDDSRAVSAGEKP